MEKINYRKKKNTISINGYGLIDTQSVWLQTQFWNGLQLPQPISFINAMEAALKNLNSADFDTLCITCWMIWNYRNKLIFENKIASYKDLWARAELYRLEFMEVQQKQNQVAEVQKMKWQPPNSDSIHKLNLAISQSKKNTSVGFGFLIRNNKGEVLVASCHRLQKNLNLLCTAATVMRLALLFCQNNSFYNVMVECNFVELLNSDRICCLEAAWIIEDIGLIRDSFSFISFHSIPLRCNRATLALVSAAKENEEAIIWLKECPSFFFPIVQSDLIE